jgi:photosystem II stability/assembly factor-like uncharacterized protein
MGLKALTTIMLMILSTSTLGADWVWQNPYPYGNWLTDVLALDSNHIFAVGDFSDLLLTKDGGTNWECASVYRSDVTLTGISFADSSTIWAVGTSGSIVRTTDGGMNWSAIDGKTTEHLWDVFFISKDRGWICGGSFSHGGIVLSTSDGGATWTQHADNKILSACFFLTEDVGWVVGYEGTILKTVDGGSTWTSQISPSSADLQSVFFVSDSLGWIVGSGGIIMKTSNGGQSWTFKQIAGANDLSDVAFASSDTGWVVGDGGSNWIPQSSGTFGSLSAVYYHVSTGCWVVGNGFVTKSTDAGNTWEPITRKATSANLSAVYFVDSSNGFAVGAGGVVLSTTDGGTIWTPGSSTTSQDLHSVKFLDSSNGVIVGVGGTILRTMNGGAGWTTVNSGTSNDLHAIYFIGDELGWACGANGNVLRTNDGGMSWATQNSYTTRALNSVFFIDSLLGWAVGDEGALIKTSDGGNDWSSPATLDLISARFVHFSTPDTGWAGGSPRNEHPSSGQTAPSMLSTTDGGSTWSQRQGGFSLDPDDDAFLCIQFSSRDTAWMLQGENRLYTSVNGGSSWSGRGFVPAYRSLTSTYFLNGTTGWLVGENGTILRTKTGGGDGTGIRDIERHQALNQLHSPTKIIITLRSSLPTLMLQLEKKAFLTVDVYDLSGRRVYRLPKRHFAHGSIALPLLRSYQPSTTYLARIQIGNEVQLKRFTMLKK